MGRGRKKNDETSEETKGEEAAPFLLFGIRKGLEPGKWLAVTRDGATGAETIHTPTRNGKHVGEGRHLAIARTMSAWSREVLS